jgi:signal transduction histidine kinase
MKEGVFVDAQSPNGQRASDAPAADRADPAVAYAAALAEYLTTRGEAALYQASLLSQRFVEQGVGPEEIVALHAEAFHHAAVGLNYREQARAAGDGLQFLLEAMIAHGVQYQAAMEARLRAQADHAAAERARADQAERLVDEKSDVLTVVAHELRTPLTGAKGNVDLAARLVEQGRPETLPLLLARTQDAIAHLSRLTRDLLDAGRGREPEIERRPVDLDDVLAKASAWVIELAAEKGVVLSYAPASAPVVVLGDADALQRVAANLLSNAVRYTMAGGRVAVSCAATSTAAIVEVVDTGIGIPQEQHGRIFEKFYRSPDAHRLDTHGLGLGLAIVQRVVAAHGGRVQVESAPGAGSTFRVTLPRHAP